MMINHELLFLEQSFVLYILLFLCFQLLFVFSTSQWAIFKKIKMHITCIYTFILVILAVYIIYSIALIPFEMYVYWITLIQMGSPGGAISQLFVWVQVFFLCLFSGISYYKKYSVSILGILLSQCILFSILYHNVILYSATTLAIIIAALYIFLTNKKDDSKASTYFYYLIRIFTILSISFLLSLFVPLYQGWLGEMSLLPALRQFFSKDFPVSPIISTVGDISSWGSRSDLGGTSFSKRQVFQISGENEIPFYIRISAYNNYRQSTWYNSYDELEVKDDWIIQFDHKGDTSDIEISLLADYYIQIPHTLHTEKLSIWGPLLRKFIFASFDHGFKLNLPLTGGKKISVKESRAASPEIVELSEEDRQKYLFIPWYIKDSVSTLIDLNELNHKTTDEKIMDILKFLRTKYTYSLKISSINKKQDEVIQFLKVNKQGFCQHFSSSFIFFARMCDIPSRYVTGYYGIIPAKMDSVVLTEQSAHAWAEVWMPETGWRTVEATPPFLLNRTEQMGFISRMKDSSTKRQLITILQINDPQKKGDTVFFIYHLKIYSIVAFVVLIFGILLVTGKRIKPWRIIRTKEYKVIGLYKSIIKKGYKKSIPGPEILGWKKWAESFGNKQGLGRGEIGQLVNIAYSCFFTSREPHQEDIDQLKTIKKKVFLKNKVQIEEILKEYIFYYNNKRPHQGIEHQVPNKYKSCKNGKIIKLLIFSGLHHH